MNRPRLVEAVLLGAVFLDLAAFGSILPDVQTSLERFGARGWLIGLILGPAAGGWLSHVGGNFLLGLTAASLSALAALALALVIPHRAPTPATAAEAAKPRARFALLREVPALGSLFVLAATAWFALACLEGTFGRLIHQRLGYGPREYGLIFGYEALLGVLLQAFLLGQITKRLAPVALLRLGYALQGIGLGLTPFAPSLAWLFAYSTLYAIGAGVANPTINARCSAVTPSDRQGEMFGLLQAARSVGFLLGPLLGGILFDWRSDSPYLLAAGVMLLAGLLARTAATR